MDVSVAKKKYVIGGNEDFYEKNEKKAFLKI